MRSRSARWGRSVSRLGSGVGYTGKHGSRCHLRIDRIALPLAMANRTIRSVNFDDSVASIREEAGHSGALGTRTLNPERTSASQSMGPPFEFLIPLGGRGHVPLAKSNTLQVNGYRHMLIFVSIDSDNYTDCVTTLVTCDS